MYFDRIKKYQASTFLACVLSLAGLTACASDNAGPSQQNLPTIEVLVGTKTVVAELANTDLTRQTGLMNRPLLAANSGMLFVFKRSETQCMWMRNTLIDLDVAFADENGTILNVAQMKAGTSDIHCSNGNAKLALEMNLNWFSRQKLGEGDQLKIPPGAMKAL